MLNSFDQSSLLAMGSITISLSWDAEGSSLLGVPWVPGVVSDVSGWLHEGIVRLEGEFWGSLVAVCVSDGTVRLCLDGLSAVLFGLKKPLSVFCPGVEYAGAGVAVDFARLIKAGGVGSLFSVLLRLMPLVALLSFVTWTGGVSDAAGDCDFASWTEVVRSSVVDIVLDFCTGVRVNISLMLLLLSNSGINRPDMGRSNLVVYSC